MRISDWSSDVCSSDLAAIARDRAEGIRLLMATAAPEFYAGAIAEALGFDAIVATRRRRAAAGNWLPALDGGNCYGADKSRRVREWLDPASGGGAGHLPAYSLVRRRTGNGKWVC